MANIFGLDSKPMAVLDRIVDIVVINIIFIITCLPIVTIGASVTALYTVTFKVISHEDGHVIRRYFNSWKSNFKQSTIVWLFELGMMLVLYVDTRLCVIYNFSFKLPVIIIIMLVSILVGISTLFIFPIIAKFDVSIKNMFINSLCIPFSDIFAMITIIAINIIPIVIALYSTQFFSVWCYLVIMGWFAMIAYFSSFFFNKIFSKFIVENAEETEDKDRI